MKNHKKIALTSSLGLLLSLAGCDWCACMKKETSTTEAKAEPKKEEAAKASKTPKAPETPKVMPEVHHVMPPEAHPVMPMPEPHPVMPMPVAPKMPMPEPKPAMPMPVAPKHP